MSTLSKKYQKIYSDHCTANILEYFERQGATLRARVTYGESGLNLSPLGDKLTDFRKDKEKRTYTIQLTEQGKGVLEVHIGFDDAIHTKDKRLCEMLLSNLAYRVRQEKEVYNMFETYRRLKNDVEVHESKGDNYGICQQL